MSFNENSLFYAALYWTEALPGGEAFTDVICKKHGKPYMPMTPPKRVEQGPLKIDEMQVVPPQRKKDVQAKLETGVTQAECEAFFGTLYTMLMKGTERTRNTGTYRAGTNHRYLEMRRSGGMSRLQPYMTFNESIEMALSFAELDRELLPRGGCYIHESGELFVRGSNAQDAKFVDYPGRPDTGYKHVTFTKEEREAAPKAHIVELMRLVSLDGKDSYNYVEIDRNGKRDVQKGFPITPGSDIFTLHHYEATDIFTLSDEEILSGESENVWGGIALDKETVTPGYLDKIMEYFIEATDDPRVVRRLSKAKPCFTATEKIQVGFGENFMTLNPGDKVLAAENNRYNALRQEDLASGKRHYADERTPLKAKEKIQGFEIPGLKKP